MAQKNNNPKQAEFELIEKLFAMDGYFAAAFSKEDMEIMGRNILADYDLLCSTTRDESDKIGSLERELQSVYAQLEERARLISDLTTERDAAISNMRDAQKMADQLRDEKYKLQDRVNNLEMQVLRRNLMLGKDLLDEQRQSLVEILEGFED